MGRRGVSIAAFVCSVILLAGLPMPAPAHDVHISYCTSSVENGRYSARVTYYKDDFARAVCDFAHLDLNTVEVGRLSEAMVEYLRAHFLLRYDNGSQPTLTVLAGGSDPTSVWFKLSFELTAHTRSIEVEHRAHFELFRDQMNLIGINVNGEESNLILTSGSPSGVVRLL